MTKLCKIAALLILTGCVSTNDVLVKPTERDGNPAPIHVPSSMDLPPPGPDGGWMFDEQGQPSFIGMPEPNPPALSREGGE